MKNAKLLLIGVVLVSAMGSSLAISQVVLAQVEWAKKDIAGDNTNINNEVGGLPDDTFAIKADRQALKEAMDSGDKEKIKEARKALREDLKVKAKIRKDIQKEAKEKREDKRRTHRGNRDRGEDKFGLYQDTFDMDRDTFDMQRNSFDLQRDTVDMDKKIF